MPSHTPDEQRKRTQELLTESTATALEAARVASISGLETNESGFLRPVTGEDLTQTPIPEFRSTEQRQPSIIPEPSPLQANKEETEISGLLRDIAAEQEGLAGESAFRAEQKRTG